MRSPGRRTGERRVRNRGIEARGPAGLAWWEVPMNQRRAHFGPDRRAGPGGSAGSGTALSEGEAGPGGSLVERLAARWAHEEVPIPHDVETARFFLRAIADELDKESRRIVGPPADTEDAVYRTEKSYGYWAAANHLRTEAAR